MVSVSHARVKRICCLWSSASHAHISFVDVLATATSPHLAHLPFGPVLQRHPPTSVRSLGSETQIVSLKRQLRVVWMVHASRCCLTTITIELLYIFESIGHEALGEDLQAYLGDLR